MTGPFVTDEATAAEALRPATAEGGDRAGRGSQWVIVPRYAASHAPNPLRRG